MKTPTLQKSFICLRRIPTNRDSRCLLMTSAVLFTATFLISAGALIYSFIQLPNSPGFSFDPGLIVNAVWIATSLVGLSVNSGLAWARFGEQD